MKDLIETAELIGKTISQKMKSEASRKEVGAETTTKFEHFELEYELEVNAFWESSDHFDYRVTGIGFDFSHYKCCVPF